MCEPRPVTSLIVLKMKPVSKKQARKKLELLRRAYAPK
jgi:hypothetical protein